MLSDDDDVGAAGKQNGSIAPSKREDDSDGMDDDMEEVELPSRPRSEENAGGDDEDEEEGEDDEDEDEDDDMEEVDLAEGGGKAVDEEAYAAAYEAADAAAAEEDGNEGGSDVPIFKDGKGQPGGISISIHGPQKRALELKLGAKRKGPIITHRDRVSRLAAHKWMVLAVIAHTRWRCT